ncbi:MAG: hypothetical protein HYZ29_33400 [Myxococcales bacterium]|nr:hypothetical protein [Myxococcales bacterium]
MSDTFLRRALVGGLFVLATACGGGDSGGGGGGNTGGTGGGGQVLDACAIVTQSDADQLFGKPAEKGKPSASPDPALLGECVWQWEDAEANSHLLQFSAWEGESYYQPSAKATPFAIGDKGVIEVGGGLVGVDIQWLQASRVYDLSYFTVGKVPDATTRVDAVKALALQTATKLK